MVVWRTKMFLGDDALELLRASGDEQLEHPWMCQDSHAAVVENPVANPMLAVRREMRCPTKALLRCAPWDLGAMMPWSF